MSGLHSFKFIDLFAGIGGFHHALEALGGECVFASDVDPHCRAVYSATWPNHPDTALIGDIRSITRTATGADRPKAAIARLIPDHDVLCAGFPCQPFSKSGLQHGLMDTTRGTLFFDIMAIARAKQPRFLVLENVRNLAGPRHVETLSTMIAILRESGYRVADTPVIMSPHLLPPELGGRPQIRERVFILAEFVGKRRASQSFSVDIGRNPYPDWNPNDWNVEDWLQPDHEIMDLDKYQLSTEEIAALDAWQAFLQGIADDNLPGFPIWSDYFKRRITYPRDAPEWKRDFIKKNHDFYFEHRQFIDDWMSRSWIAGRDFRVSDFNASRRKFEWQARKSQPTAKTRDLWKLAIHFRPSGIRVRPLTYLPTVVAITQTSVIGPRRRYLTPIEVGRLQGIPDDVFVNAGIDDKHAYKQAGNAVNVGVVRYVTKRLFEDAGATWLQPSNSGAVRT